MVRGETAKSLDPAVDTRTRDESCLSERVQDSILRKKNMMHSSSVNYEDAERGQLSSSTSSDTAASSLVEHEHGRLVDGPKKVQFELQKDARSHGNIFIAFVQFLGSISVSL